MRAEAADAKPGRRAAWALRIAISGGLLVFLFLRIDIREIVAALGNISALLFGLGCLLFLCGQVINTERWRTLLVMALGSAPTRRFLLRLVFVGMFFNFFLPSTVGGDVVRAEMAMKRVGGRTDAYLSIVIARLMAFMAVLLIGLAASLFAWQRLGWFDRDLALSTLVFLLPIVAIFVVTGTGAIDRLTRVKWLPMARLGGALGVVRSFRAYTSSRSGLAWVFVLSVLAQFAGNVFVVWALGEALGIPVPLSFHMVAIPLITLITLLPISINGIGVREGGFVYFYAKVGVAGDAAVALSLAYTLVLAVFSMLGGLSLLLGRGGKVDQVREGP